MLTSQIPTPALTPPIFHVMSVRKLIVLSIFSFCIYLLYWHYRNLAIYCRAAGLRISPVLRALLAPLFLYRLLGLIDEGQRSTSSDLKRSPKRLAVCLISTGVLALLSEILMRGWYPSGLLRLAPVLQTNLGLLVLYVVSLVLWGMHLWFMAAVQRSINSHERHSCAVINSRWELVEWLWVIPGVGILVLVMAYFLAPWIFWAYVYLT